MKQGHSQGGLSGCNIDQALKKGKGEWVKGKVKRKLSSFPPPFLLPSGIS